MPLNLSEDLTRTISALGAVEHRDADGQLHRLDGPAVVTVDGSEYWYLHGQQHRTDGPVVTTAEGSKTWWQHGVPHRVDGPAVIRADGRTEWWINGFRRLDLEQKAVNKDD